MPILSSTAPKTAKKARMHEEMGKFKRGELHSGSRKGPVVTDHSQALAIALHESGASRKQRKSGRSNSRSTRR